MQPQAREPLMAVHKLGLSPARPPCGHGTFLGGGGELEGWQWIEVLKGGNPEDDPAGKKRGLG